MPLPESFSEVARSFREQRSRTVVTLVGIAWGTFSVVLLLALGWGLEAQLQREADGLGRSIAVVWPATTTKPFEGLGPGRPMLLRAEDVAGLALQIPEIELISPEHIYFDTVEVGSRVHRVALTGVHPAYGELRTWKVQPGGRFLNDRDLAEGRRVAVLGTRVKEALFGAADAVGRTVIVRGEPLLVIGVMASKLQEGSYASPDRDRICLPITTHEQLFGTQFISAFVYRARGLDLHARATDRIYEALGRRYRFDPSDRRALSIWDTTETERIRSYAFVGFNLMLGAAGVLTLLVGGVGAGNLMFIRVRQRTREIGIQMAVGATPRRILRQILGESLVLVGAGGALGFGLSCAVTEIASVTPLTERIGEPHIPLALACGTVVVLAAVGILAGYFPARRAARLDPVRALLD